MNGPVSRFSTLVRWVFLLALVCFSLPAMAQNTKGEQPVNNQRQIRETKGKSIKRKDKTRTRDIAGRRLRTKNKSSANSANVGIRQPNPYSKRPRVSGDRAARPRDRVYSESPSERPRQPKGDISGHRLRTKRPSGNDAASANVYREPRAFINNRSATPRGENPPRNNKVRTASGDRVVRLEPRSEERAWKGNMRGQPFVPPRSISAERENTHPPDYRYSSYVSRKAPRERAMSNQREVNRSRRMSQSPRTKGPGGTYVSSGNPGFVRRGRKNVYWGKFSKGEKPYTRDLTGAPLRQKNYRSPAAGLVGRDTLQYFGRKPGGDVSFAGKRQEGASLGVAGKGWRGDISGRPLRKNRPTRTGVAGENVFPRKLSASAQGERAGRSLPHAPISQRRRGETVGRPVPGRAPGIGGKAVADGLARTKGRPTKGFTSQGEGFSGFIKSKGRRGTTLAAEMASQYAGNDRGGQGKTFENQGEGFSGYIKTKKPFKGGGSISGGLWNNGNTAIAKKGIPASSERVGRFSGNMRGGQGKTFESQGEGFSGYIKARKPIKGGGSVSGGLWNNGNSAIAKKGIPASAEMVGRFSGNLRGGQGKTFENQGEGFSGYTKAKKPLKGGGSVSGEMWNNRNSPTPHKVLPAGSERPASFAGNMRGQGKSFDSQGADFTGYIKTKKPLKGGGSVSREHWSNDNTPIARTVLPAGAERPVTFSGNAKAKKPAKGGGSISGELWNNDEESITVSQSSAASRAAANFQGRSKAGSTKKSTSGFDDFGKFRVQQDFTQSPYAVSQSTRKHTPDKDGFDVKGSKVKVPSANFSAREHSVSGALRGVGPSRAAERASEFSSGMKVTADRRHNPNSSDDALKTTYYGGRTTAKMGSFHGSMKVKKHGSGLHPDAKFANTGENNVEGERTILTNVKLFWTKLFHKSESQPSHIKEKERRPRYDKGEIGMWAE